MPDLNLGVIGNSSVAALIDRRGRIVWYCLPRFDGDPVFCSLLNGEDPAEGFAEILLENLASASQEYLGNTSVLVTTLTDSHGATLRITDFAPRFKQYDRRFRPAMLIRRVDVVSGLPAIRIRIRPAGDHGRVRPARTRGTKSATYICTTVPNVLSPSTFHSLERCSPLIAETSTLNCSANSATTSSDAGSASTGSAGRPSVRAHTRRTKAVNRPSPGERATSRVRSS